MRVANQHMKSATIAANLPVMPDNAQDAYLFEPASNIHARTTRKVHIRRLFDVLQLSIHHGYFQKARRAWAILMRCKELDWRLMWRTGVLLVDERSVLDEGLVAARLEYLQTVMLQHAESVSALHWLHVADAQESL